VAQEVAGSIPVAHPKFETLPDDSLTRPLLRKAGKLMH
jgi:hypothetical protein